jgi:hypothetical protein
MSENQKMENKITFEDIERRNEPIGKFAHIGGIGRRPGGSVEGSPRVDFSDAYGDTGRRVL